MARDKKPEVPEKKPLPIVMNFVNAGLAGMCATCVVHPMDVLKNRMQMSKEGLSLTDAFKNVIYNEGFFKFYTGLSASLLRQATYTTTRLGTYNQLQDVYAGYYPGKPHIAALMLMGGSAGAMGAYIGTPADVALVRMTSDGRLPPAQRRNYKNVMDAFTKIVKTEGVLALWKGSLATVGRAIVVNTSQLASYSQTKHMITEKFQMNEGIPLHFCASVFSGFLTTFNSMPFDIAKTRIQNLAAGEKSGIINMVTGIVKNEGIWALWKGFWPCYARVGPHTVITFIVNEQFNNLYRLYFMQEPKPKK